MPVFACCPLLVGLAVQSLFESSNRLTERSSQARQLTRRKQQKT